MGARGKQLHKAIQGKQDPEEGLLLPNGLRICYNNFVLSVPLSTVNNYSTSGTLNSLSKCVEVILVIITSYHFSLQSIMT